MLGIPIGQKATTSTQVIGKVLTIDKRIIKIDY